MRSRARSCSWGCGCHWRLPTPSHEGRSSALGSEPCVLFPAGVKKRTKVIKNNVNPVWNEVSVSPSPSPSHSHPGPHPIPIPFPSPWGAARSRGMLWAMVQAQRGAPSPRGCPGAAPMEGLRLIPLWAAPPAAMDGTEPAPALCSRPFPFHQDVIRAEHTHGEKLFKHMAAPGKTSVLPINPARGGVVPAPSSSQP